MVPFVCPEGVTLDNTQSFIAEITRIFGDSDQTATASRELGRLRQGSRDFTRYYADFARLTAILNLSEKTKVQTLKRGISNEIRNATAYQGIPDNETLER